MSQPALSLVPPFREFKRDARKRGKSKIAQHVVLRAGVYYYRRMIQGKRYWESLDTGDHQAAISRARIKESAIDAARWEDLDATRQRRAYATVGKLIDVYKIICARQGQVRTISVKANVGSLLLVLRQSAGIADPRAASTRALTGAALVALLDERLASSNGTMEAQDKARRTVASIARKARCVVQSKLEAEYKAAGVILPNLADFRDRFLTVDPKITVTLPTAAEVEILKRAADRLPETDKRLYPIWLLAYHCALRAGEIAHCKWTWFEKIEGRTWVVIKKRAEENYMPKGRAGAVPIAAECWTQLLACRVAGQEYLVEGPTDNWRYDVVTRDFSSWMRANGWTHHSISHAIRKWRIQKWRETYDLHIARDWGRHADTTVTQDYYTHSRNASRPPMED